MSEGIDEFGFIRTECACGECVRNCHFIPGYLVPTDLQRIADYLGEADLAPFALNHLLASPGATVVVAGELFQIPTLTPARKPDGACHFLLDERCAIHTVSPFACRYFDHSQTRQQADAISMRGLIEIARAWARNDLYARLWLMLHEAGRIAPSPIEARARMRAAVERVSEIVSSNDYGRVFF